MSLRGNAPRKASKACSRAISLLLLLLLLFTAAVPAYAADGAQRRVVKVGNMDYPGFIQKDEEGEYSGYGVEYLQEVCEHADWEIVYVDAPWHEQLEMLERGEIDLVPIAQYSEERAERFIYCYQPMGILQCLLLTLPEGENDIRGNALACDGKTIGVQRGSRDIELLADYAKRMGFRYDLKEYDYHSELEKALFDKEVDIIACEQMVQDKELRILDRFASDPYYFLGNKNNKRLMEELDYAMSAITAYDPLYGATLHEKYFGNNFKSSVPYFTREEMEFIEACGKVHIVFPPDNKPAAYYDDEGEIVGLVPDVLQRITELSGIEFINGFVPNDVMPLELLKANPSYLAGGVLADNPAFKTEGVITSDVFYSNYSVLAAHEGKAEKVDPNKAYTIGITKSFQTLRLFLQKNYPNMQIVEFLNFDEGMQALESGKIDYIAYNGSLMRLYLANPLYADVLIVEDHFMINNRSIAALDSPENRMLIDIINKCLALISDDAILQMENEHLQKSMYRFDKSDVLHRYRDVLMVTAMVVMGGFAILVTLLWLRQRKYTRDITLHAEYDMMTGLYNRATLTAKARELIEQTAGKHCACIMIDIDDLKRINDTRGNDAGDEAIKALSNVLKSQFRNSNTSVVGRIGGDEFGAFMSNVESKAMLIPALARLQQAISMTEIANGTAALSASIGIAMGVAGQDNLDILTRQADEALHRMKEAGKNGFMFYDLQKSISLSIAAEKDAALEPIEVDAPQAAGETDAIDAALSAEDDLNYKNLIEAFPNVALYVIERSTRRVLYYNKRFKEICPPVSLGMSCREIKFGPCQNCIVDAMGEQKVAHSFFYSDFFGDELEITATRVMWNGETPAIMISSWPRNLLTSSAAHLPSASNQDAFDYVTGGLTRSGFIRSMERMKRGGVDLCEYAILFINIKDFKAVNEMAGCDGGDDLLHTLFERIEHSALHPIIGARKESDHFVFMVERGTLELLTLPELLNFYWQYNGKDMFIHCRCGIFNIEDDELAIYKMIDRAKLAKEHIVDDYVQPYAVYDPSMLEEYSENASAFLFFDKGMKDREFVVYYQPVVDAKTEKVIAAEALIRRITAEGKVISPGKFIPILERTGYISMLDRFVAEQVGAFLNKRVNNNLPAVPISFNISQKDFYDSDLMETLASGLENGDFPKGYALLELTESAYTLHEKKHEEYLKRLRASGAKILLDDFGTGYSSFGMFENYNFDRVKLDMSFVRQLAGNENVREVVAAIIAMCHNLGVQVVAEGVETEEELSILRGMDCDYIQGYYFSKPLDEKSFVEYLTSHS